MIFALCITKLAIYVQSGLFNLKEDAVLDDGDKI